MRAVVIASLRINDDVIHIDVAENSGKLAKHAVHDLLKPCTRIFPTEGQSVVFKNVERSNKCCEWFVVFLQRNLPISFAKVDAGKPYTSACLVNNNRRSLASGMGINQSDGLQVCNQCTS